MDRRIWFHMPLMLLELFDELSTFNDAIKSSEARAWILAMQEEIDSHENNQIWSLVEKPPHHKLVS